MEALYVLKTLAVRPSISSDKYLFNDVVYIGQREFQRRDVNMNHDEIVFPIVTRKHTENLRIVAKRTCNTSLPQKIFHIGHEIEKKKLNNLQADTTACTTLFSNYSRLQRIVSSILTFINNSCQENEEIITVKKFGYVIPIIIKFGGLLP